MGLGKFGAVTGAAVVAALALAPVVHAADSNPNGFMNRGHFYAAIMPGWLYTARARGTHRANFTASGILGWNFAPHWDAELNLFGSTLYTNRNQFQSNFYQEGLSLDLAYNLFDNDNRFINPFVIAGIAGVYDDVIPNRNDAVSPQANAGVGAISGPLFHHGFLKGLRFRIEARFLYDYYRPWQGSYEGFTRTRRGLGEARASVGFQLPLGNTTVRTVQAPPPPPVVKIVKVPETKIIHCPAPFPGAKLDKYGCVIAPQTVILHGVHFAFNKTSLRPDAQTLLDQVAAAMKGEKTMTVQIAGFTDDIGSQKYNLKLSKGRADSVRGYLITKGVDGSRMTTIGYGKDKPIVTPQNTPQERAFNRRIEFHILTP